MVIDNTPLLRFMQRVSKMGQLKQTDIRLTLAEAAEISAVIASVLATQMVVAEPPSVVALPVVITHIDGGNFRG